MEKTKEKQKDIDLFFNFLSNVADRNQIVITKEFITITTKERNNDSVRTINAIVKRFFKYDKVTTKSTDKQITLTYRRVYTYKEIYADLKGC